jgi:AcrR family transcriptional regulator
MLSGGAIEHDLMTDTRERLIEAAAELLDRGGPAAVTLREVGRIASVSRSAPYRHFSDKGALLAAIAARELTRQRGNLARASDSAAGLRTMLKGYMNWAMRRPERFHLIFDRWDRDDADLRRVAHEARDALSAAVAAAQARKELPPGDPERLSALLRATAHGAANLALAGHLSTTGKGKANADDLITDLFEHLAGGLEPYHEDRDGA